MGYRHTIFSDNMAGDLIKSLPNSLKKEWNKCFKFGEDRIESHYEVKMYFLQDFFTEIHKHAIKANDEIDFVCWADESDYWQADVIMIHLGDPSGIRVKRAEWGDKFESIEEVC